MTQLYNLDNYETHSNYYELYTKNNTRLNEIIQKIIRTYNFEYNPIKYYRLDTVNIITKNIYELSGIIIMLNAIIEKTFYGYCIKTGVKYACEKMYYSNNVSTKYASYVYHFNCSGDEFVIMFSWEYFSPFLIYYPKTKYVYNINYRYSDILYHINNINSTLNNIDYTITYYPKSNYTSYVIGIMQNAGHYFSQEVHGLMLIFEYDLLDKIDEFIIYKYDYLNIANILRDKYNKKITYLNSDSEYHNLTVNISKHFATNLSTEIFKDMYGLIKTNNISLTNEINIMFDIRSNSRIWLNQIPIIINIMNGLKNKYSKYNINFYISGFYTYNKTYLNTVYNEIKEINSQNKIFNIIQSKVSFPIFNLINKKLSEIINISQNIELCIANLGSGIGFYYSTIFNKDIIGFTNSKNSVIFDSLRFAFENKLNKYTSIHPYYITDDKDNFILKNGSLYNAVISKLNGFIPSQKTL
jgi:hypothetical protein